MKKICKYCGKEFEATGRVYCSSECHEQARISNHTFVCKGCGISFYSAKFNVAYCTDKCRKRQSRPRHIHRCPTCIKIFFGPAKRTYCSRECEYGSMRKAERDHTCINCGKEFSRPKRNRDSCQFCSRDCAFEYKGRNKKTAWTDRQSLCDVCNKSFVALRANQKYCSAECRYKAQKNSNSYNNADRRHACYVPKEVACRNCGKIFLTEYKKSKVFCSDSCGMRYAKERNHMRTRHRLDGKIVDGDITLTKLSNRDGGTCQLCGLPVDWSDYIVNENGAFIAGKNYPSVDHIYPISRGGLHAWGNVQLAHFSCNSFKSDSIA